MYIIEIEGKPWIKLERNGPGGAIKSLQLEIDIETQPYLQCHTGDIKRCHFPHLVQFLKLLTGGGDHVPDGLSGAVHGLEGVEPHEAGVGLGVCVAHLPGVEGIENIWISLSSSVR